MLEVYVVVACILTFVFVIGSILSTIFWSLDRNVASKRTYQNQAMDDVQVAAKRTLMFYAGIPLAWAWPLTIPLGILYLISRVVNDATRPTN